MSRRRTTESPPVIDPHAYYSRIEATALLRLRPSTLSTEIGKGRLRVSRRAGRYWFLGEWILDWLAAGECPSRMKPEAVEEASENSTDRNGIAN